MEYRRLGSAGLKVSVLSFGSWVTFDNQLDTNLALDCMQAAYDAGVNFFDNAEVYAGGESERIMGKALAELGWPRHSYVVSSKFYMGIHKGPNTQTTLNRKYLLEAVDQSLERFGLDHLDLIFCHRADPETPIEETVWAMHNIIESGRAFYWGTSEWTAHEYREAWDIADRRNLHKPQMEQPQYNLLSRERVEQEYLPLYDELGMGTTIWSPLASGVLTGKYLEGIPDGSRGTVAGYEWLRDAVITDEANNKVRGLLPIADDLGCSPAQLAIAWCAKNPHVSTVITGASRASQVTENMASLEVMERLDDEVMARIETAVA
ncbi:MAG: potassium channel beta subunit family protein [Acidimicrobiales bacterium]